MHRDSPAGAVGQVDPRILAARDAALVEKPHSVNQRAALRRPFHQSQLTRHRGLPRSYRLLYSISLTIKDGAHRIAPMHRMSGKVRSRKKSLFLRFGPLAVMSAGFITAL